jgi:hypothetical protein
MGTHRLFQPFWLRGILKLLVWEVVLVALTWLFHEYVGTWKRTDFRDFLFLVGTLELLGASIGMLRSPYGVVGASGFGQGVPALPVETTEQEQRYQDIAEAMQRNKFALYMGSSGLLTVVLAFLL